MRVRGLVGFFLTLKCSSKYVVTCISIIESTHISEYSFIIIERIIDHLVNYQPSKVRSSVNYSMAEALL